MPSRGGTQRTIGLVLGGVGVLGIGAGSALGLISKSTYTNALQNECGKSASGCTAQGASDGQTAHTQALMSTVGFITGGALLAAGALLVFYRAEAQCLHQPSRRSPKRRPPYRWNLVSKRYARSILPLHDNSQWREGSV